MQTGTPFFPNCSEVNSTGYSEFDEPISTRLTLSTQVNSTFRAGWLASSEVIAAEEKQNGFCRYIVTNKVHFWAASYSACVVYTKTIIQPRFGESGRYLSPLWWITVKGLLTIYMWHNAHSYLPGVVKRTKANQALHVMAFNRTQSFDCCLRGSEIKPNLTRTFQWVRLPNSSELNRRD